MKLFVSICPVFSLFIDSCVLSHPVSTGSEGILSEISSIESAWLSYSFDQPVLASELTKESVSNRELVGVLTANPKSEYRRFNPEHKVYLEFMRLSAEGEALDGWNSPFRIETRKSVSKTGKTSNILKIYSVGPNRYDEKGGGDDILNVGSY